MQSPSLFGGLAASTPRTALVLAAGRGTRMRPLTDDSPKVLLPVAGQSLLDHALDRLAAFGIGQVVVNAHWRAEQIERRLKARSLQRGERPWARVQHEAQLLETGGAVAAALAAGGLDRDAPFFVVNGDSLWLDGPRPALRRLADRFDAAGTDVVLLVSRVAWAVGDVGRPDFSGDFALDPDGRVRRRRERELVPYVYAGVQIVSPRLFDEVAPDLSDSGIFSMNPLWDRAVAEGRLRALVHDAPWFHLSRPADLASAAAALRDPMAGPPNT